MIMSPKIEALAFKGLCRWVVFNTGYTSAYTLPVPNGGFILLRQIIWNPTFSGATKLLQLTGNAHQVSLVEQGSNSELVYQFRDALQDVGTGLGLAPANTATAGTTILETWGIFKNDVCIDILVIPDVAGAVYAGGVAFQNQAQERAQPLGYNGAAITPTVAISAAETYFPAGQSRLFTGTAFAGATVSDTLRYNYLAARQIPAPPAADATRQNQFPLISFGCWVFNIPVSEYLNY